MTGNDFGTNNASASKRAHGAPAGVGKAEARRCIPKSVGFTKPIQPVAILPTGRTTMFSTIDKDREDIAVLVCEGGQEAGSRRFGQQQ